MENHLTHWHRQMAASIAAAHPLTPSTRIRAGGNALAAANDEPEPVDPLFAAAHFQDGRDLFQRPECAKHTWSTRVVAMALLREDGFASGYWQAEVTRTCDCCPAFQTWRQPGTRARSADEALALYRKVGGAS